MKKKLNIDPELLRAYMLGGTSKGDEHDIDGVEEKIDLHIDAKHPASANLTSGQKLQLQINQVHKQIDSAIAKGLLRIEIVHGQGTGKLRREVHQILLSQPEVTKYEESWDGGKTTVYF